MVKLTRRQKQIGFAVVVLLPLAVFLVDRVFGGPTPEQARAALAEAGWCEPLAHTERHAELVRIGDCLCDLENRLFQTPRGSGTFEYSWGLSSSAPFGRWIATPRFVKRAPSLGQ
jgi:hypothetical protein